MESVPECQLLELQSNDGQQSRSATIYHRVQPRSDDEFQVVDAAEHTLEKGGLVPLHNDCQLMLVERRTNVNVASATRKTLTKVRTFS